MDLTLTKEIKDISIQSFIKYFNEFNEILINMGHIDISIYKNFIVEHVKNNMSQCLNMKILSMIFIMLSHNSKKEYSYLNLNTPAKFENTSLFDTYIKILIPDIDKNNIVYIKYRITFIRYLNIIELHVDKFNEILKDKGDE